MKFQQRSYAKELLDQDNIPFEDIKRNMQELNFINTWLGGHKITLQGLRDIASNKKEVTVCEIGCGGGDNLAAIVKALQQTIIVTCIGIDIKKECIDFAKKNNVLKNNTQWITSDYNDVSFDNKPDIIFSSLFCHHFTEEQLVSQLQWMQKNAVLGFFINDLQRHSFAYYSIKLLTQIFSKSYLVKNDAPLSVARGFTLKEWQLIFNKAGINNYKIQWKWAFRYLITCKNDR